MTLVRYNPALRNFSTRSFNNILDRFFQDSFETNGSGFVYFRLPATAAYVLSVKIGDQNEILYLEHLKPDVDYLYRADPEIHSGRADALIPVPAE